MTSIMVTGATGGYGSRAVDYLGRLAPWTDGVFYQSRAALASS